MAVLVKLVILFTTGEVDKSATPSGPVHVVLTVTGRSIAGCSTTVQVSVRSESTGRMGLDLLLVTTTVDGAWTANNNKKCNNIIIDCCASDFFN